MEAGAPIAKKSNILPGGAIRGWALRCYEELWHPLMLLLYTRTHFRFEQIYRCLRAMAPLPEAPGNSNYAVLDLACGTGWYGRRLLREERAGRLGLHVSGLDISGSAIQAAAALYRRDGVPGGCYGLVCGDAREMACFGDAVFDEAWICSALHHIPGPALTLAEIGRVLKPQGRLFVQTFLRSGAPLRRMIQGWEQKIGWNCYFDRRDLESLLRSRQLLIRKEALSGPVFLFCAAKEDDGDSKQ